MDKTHRGAGASRKDAPAPRGLLSSGAAGSQKPPARISAITAGVEVNPEQQCLTPEGEIIPGLYAVGTCAGNFYGGVDSPLAIGGLSLGRCYNQGRMVGAAVAAL